MKAERSQEHRLCARERMLLVELAAGELEGREAERCQQHLEKCCACREELERLTAAISALREIRQPTVKQEAVNKLLIELQSLAVPVAGRAVRVPALSMGAAASVLVGIAIVVTMWHQPSPTAPPSVGAMKWVEPASRGVGAGVGNTGAVGSSRDLEDRSHGRDKADRANVGRVSNEARGIHTSRVGSVAQDGDRRGPPTLSHAQAVGKPSPVRRSETARSVKGSGGQAEVAGPAPLPAEVQAGATGARAPAPRVDGTPHLAAGRETTSAARELGAGEAGASRAAFGRAAQAVEAETVRRTRRGQVTDGQAIAENSEEGFKTKTLSGGAPMAIAEAARPASWTVSDEFWQITVEAPRTMVEKTQASLGVTIWGRATATGVRVQATDPEGVALGELVELPVVVPEKQVEASLPVTPPKPGELNMAVVVEAGHPRWRTAVLVPISVLPRPPSPGDRPIAMVIRAMPLKTAAASIARAAGIEVHVPAELAELVVDADFSSPIPARVALEILAEQVHAKLVPVERGFEFAGSEVDGNQ